MWTAPARNRSRTGGYIFSGSASIAAKAREAGKLAAIYVVDPKLVRRYAEMGFCMFALGNENKYISLGVDALLNQANGG